MRAVEGGLTNERAPQKGEEAGATEADRDRTPLVVYQTDSHLVLSHQSYTHIHRMTLVARPSLQKSTPSQTWDLDRLRAKRFVIRMGFEPMRLPTATFKTQIPEHSAITTRPPDPSDLRRID